MKYFNENMSSKEAQHLIFSSADTVDKATFDEMKEEFLIVIPVITKREMEEFAAQGANRLTAEV